MEQCRQLLEAARGDRLEALYVLVLTTGLRQGELLGLHWSDVEFAASTLHVRRTLSEDQHTGHLSLTEPKTRRSRRRVDLPARGLEALRAHRAGLPLTTRFHDLRHSAATLLLAQGMTPRPRPFDHHADPYVFGLPLCLDHLT